jgi:type IV pilus assembly protein PilB
MATPQRRRIGDILQEMGVIQESDIKKAIKAGREKGLRVGEALIELGFVSEDRMLWALAEQLGISYVRVSKDQINSETVKLIPEEMARRHLALPIILVGNELTLAVNDPLQEDFFNEIGESLGCEVLLSLCKAEDINIGFDKVYGAVEVHIHDEENFISRRYKQEELSGLMKDKGGLKLLEMLFRDCLSSNINTIHIDIVNKKTIVKFRIEGNMSEVLIMDAGWGRTIFTRLSMLGGVHSESGPANAFRAEMIIDDAKLGLEVHRISVRNGESAAIRVLGKRAKKIPVTKLGLTAAQRSMVDLILANPGLVIIAGPSDSGRATTVMSVLDRFDPASHRIITLEDWVRTENTGHVQITNESLPENTSRVKALASLDPDVIYVESLTNSQEFESALRAGMSGTFVFTLLEFRRAASTLQYLIDLGIHPSLAGEGVSGVVAQRLLHKLCPDCKKEVKLKPAQLVGLDDRKKEALLGHKVFEKKGCGKCNNTGFFGRVAVFEVLAVDQKLREALESGVQASQLPIDFGKPELELPFRVLDKIKKGAAAWTEILAFR